MDTEVKFFHGGRNEIPCKRPLRQVVQLRIFLVNKNVVQEFRAFLQGSSSSFIFRLSVQRSGRVTLDLGLHYYLSRVTLLGGPAVCLLRPYKSST